MKAFTLDTAAYHRLENIHRVSISETGHPATDQDSRVRYLIVLDEKRLTWVYCRYSKERDRHGLFVPDNAFSVCRVYPGFKRASEFNKK